MFEVQRSPFQVRTNGFLGFFGSFVVSVLGSQEVSAQFGDVVGFGFMFFWGVVLRVEKCFPTGAKEPTVFWLHVFFL